MACPLLALKMPVSECGYRNSAIAEPERQCRIAAVGSRGVRSRNGQQQLLARHGGENLAETAEFDRNDDDGDQRRDVDQDVLDHRDRGRRAQVRSNR